MSQNFKIETPYLPGEKGCRITWLFTDDDEKTLYLRHEDLMEIIEVFPMINVGFLIYSRIRKSRNPKIV